MWGKEFEIQQSTSSRTILVEQFSLELACILRIQIFRFECVAQYQMQLKAFHIGDLRRLES